MLLNEMGKEEILDRASKHYFSLGVDDGAASLCKENFKYGLAKIHLTQEYLGMTPNATFISTPDETISRNTARWISGYGYGGKLVWGDKNDSVLFIDTKPNACGMLVGGLEEMPEPDRIIKNISEIYESELFLDNIQIKMDSKKGNHFIDVFKTDKFSIRDRGFPPYMFVIHGSCPELRGETEKGSGIYYDKSKTLREQCKEYKTPFGVSLYLEGTSALEFMRFFEYAKQFAAQKRELIAERLFGKYTKISNPMHQGMLNVNSILLGAQHISEEHNKIYPVCLRGDLPTYIVQTVPNLTEEQIDRLGFENRAKKFDVMHRLKEFNAIPHGGGYELIGINRVIKIIEINGERFYVCEQETEDAVTILSDPTDTEYLYRGKKIINKIEALKLGTVISKLYPRFVLKI